MMGRVSERDRKERWVRLHGGEGKKGCGVETEVG